MEEKNAKQCVPYFKINPFSTNRTFEGRTQKEEEEEENH